MLVDSDDTVLYYGRLARKSAEGTATVNIPDGLLPGKYTLKIFNERLNGTKMTNYSSPFTNIALTVETVEQFSLTPGVTYYFDLSDVNIPGQTYEPAPDPSRHYVPFTYAGTLTGAYRLTEDMFTTEEYAKQNSAVYSLFISDYSVTRFVTWYELKNAKMLPYGIGYKSNSVDYTLRLPSAGSSSSVQKDGFARGIPANNEWDSILNKNKDYIKNWSGIVSWGQDATTQGSTTHVIRGNESVYAWSNREHGGANHTGVRPVLEVLNSDSLGYDALKAVTLDLQGGTVGSKSPSQIQIVVKNGSSFTAPTVDGLTPPAGYGTFGNFQWKDNSGKLYKPGDTVPASVTKLTAQYPKTEQFYFSYGGTYYFDLSKEEIPGTKNDALPDSTFHYVPFTYAGTLYDAYSLTSATLTSEGYAQKNKSSRSLFIADYAITHTVSWKDLNAKGLIFGKNYASGNLEYSLRIPSAGSYYNSKTGQAERGTPANNEWDSILDKGSSLIKNWSGMYSWGQDTTSFATIYNSLRGNELARKWSYTTYSVTRENLGYRPVLEILNSGTLGTEGLKAVTLDLNGGKLGEISDDIQIIVKNGSTFTAPASKGLTRPDGDMGNYFIWYGSDDQYYAPGEEVPAEVTRLTAQYDASRATALIDGCIYYFDLSDVVIPGNKNGDLPDSTFHYVPFVYTGTVNAYSLTSEMLVFEDYAREHTSPRSLFIAERVLAYRLSWNDLYRESLIFGKTYVSGNQEYSLRAPSVGSARQGSGDQCRGIPASNEWDAILDKNVDYIKNWEYSWAWGQEKYNGWDNERPRRGYTGSPRAHKEAPNVLFSEENGYRPVLEVKTTETQAADAPISAVTLKLNGGKLSTSSEDILIVVKRGSDYPAPPSEGLTRPEGDTGNFFRWLGENGRLYAPGDSVPASVTCLTAVFTPPTGEYAVTLYPNGGTIAEGKNVTGYTCGQSTALPTADDITYANHTFAGWYDNERFFGDPVTEISNTDVGDKEYWAKWEAITYTVTLPSGTGYTAAAADGSASPVAPGGSFSFTVTILDDYQKSDAFAVKANGTLLTETDGKYTISNITENQTVTVEGVEEIPTVPDTYTVTLPGGTGYTAAAADGSASPVASGGSFSFTVTISDGYRKGTSFAVKANGTLLTETDGKYTISNITENQTVTVEGVEEIPPAPDTYTVTLPSGTGYTAAAADGSASPVASGGSFSFTVTILDNYQKSDAFAVKANGTLLTETDGKYTISNITENQTVTVEGVEEIPPAPDTYTVTLPSGTGYTAAAADGSASPVASGGSFSFTVTILDNYQKSDAFAVKANGNPLTETDGKYTISNITENQTVTVEGVEEIPPAPTTYTVTFVANGGTGTMEPVSGVSGAYTLPACDFTAPDNKEFKAWSIDGIEYDPGATITVSDNITVTAIWKDKQITPPDPTAYTVSFNANGGSVQPASMTTGTDGKLTSLPTPARDGSYRFDGWYTEKSGGERVTTETVFDTDTTVYAHWTYTGGSGGGGGYTCYTLTFETNGGSTITSERFRSGTMVDLTKYAPIRKGCTFTGWYSNKGLTSKITSIRLDGNKTVYAGWQKQTAENPFTDVSKSDWFYDGVRFVYETGLMVGTSDTLFSPYGTATRAMMATVLWRMEGSPAPKNAPGFTDVASGKWYSDAIAWTTENGIYQGYGSGKFGPDDPITREQLAAIFYRYADYKGYDRTIKGSLDNFKDKVSTWAQDAMQWAVGSSLMKGKGSSTLDPQGTATRAEIAAMLHRFIEKYGLAEDKAPAA